MLGKSKIAVVVMSLLLGACATTENSVRKEAADITASVRKGPEAAPVKPITNFSTGLRCMDNMFFMYGVRDVVVIAEDLADQTKKVSTGTKDMLITSVSEMTKRSKAIRLVAYGADSSNLISFLKEAESKHVFQLIPQYGIRGSISQFDENVAKKTEGGGIALDTVGGIGRASMASTTILGLDLTMMRTSDLSILPGVTSSNSVAITKSGVGLEAEAGYRKFGINYQSNLSRSEGTAQAVRNLVEMASIELFGKLTKTPYWVCLGATDQSEAVKAEISDWYTAMNNEGQVIAYWQQQMRLRGLYTGEVNGDSDADLIAAISAYREAMELDKKPIVDLAFFTAYLATNHYEVSNKARKILAANKAPVAPQEPVGERAIALVIQTVNGKKEFKRGEKVRLKITPERDAHLYCFMQDEHKKIARFFPNRFTKDALVSARSGLLLPKDKEFNISASAHGVAEQVMCFASSKDIYAEVLPAIGGGDIDAPTPIGSLSELQDVFNKAAGASLGVATFTLNVR